MESGFSRHGATLKVVRTISASEAKVAACRLKPGLHTLYVAAICLIVPLLAGCRSPGSHATERLERFEFQSPHMGTLFTIRLYAPEKSVAQNAAQAAFRRVAAL